MSDPCARPTERQIEHGLAPIIVRVSSLNALEGHETLRSIVLFRRAHIFDLLLDLGRIDLQLGGLFLPTTTSNSKRA